MQGKAETKGKAEEGKGAIVEEAKEAGEGKLSKNVVKREEFPDYFLETRKVDRAGMKAPVTYELKVPKTLEAARKLYTEKKVLACFVASLRTEFDDAAEKKGSVSEELIFLKALKEKAKSGFTEEERELLKRLSGQG